jgi:SpoVK/Ycf46/Vps4 family AAA+-type ATPase
MKASKQTNKQVENTAPLPSNELQAGLKENRNWFEKVSGLDDKNRGELNKLNDWLQARKKAMQVPVNKNNPKLGFILFFYGPSLENKTQAIQIVADGFGKTIFNVDLSKIISQYAGETEKNLQQLLNDAESKNWILYFDEADALFGKRTNINDAHDRYSNQETSWLLQKIQTSSVSAIFNCKLCEEADPLFKTYFTSAIYFPNIAGGLFKRKI